MEQFLWPFLVFGALAALAAILKSRLQPARTDEACYEPREELFTAAERSFLGVLEQAVAGEYKVFGKVRLGDLIRPARGLGRKQSTGARNRVNQKHVDFVLCRPDTLEVAAAVELDDSSHRRKKRADRDEFVDRAFSSAGIALVRFPARKGYVVQEIQAKLAEHSLPSSPERQEEVRQGAANAETISSPSRQTGEAAENPQESSESYTAEPHSGTPAAPVCPACDSPMVKRQAKKGKYAGQWFWACSEYPKCRKILAVGG